MIRALTLADRLRVAKWQLRQRVVNRGAAVECPCCGRSWAAFVEFAGRAGAACPGCFSLERQRALWLWLERGDAIGPGSRILHLAPEPCLEPLLRRIGGDLYVTGDLDAPGVDVQLDVAAMPFADRSFDLVLCSHVLEHVADDRAAIRELARVAAPGATVVVMVPLRGGELPTEEDPAVTDPAERRRRFGQEDHVRAYGADVEERLRAGGLEPARHRFGERFEPELIARHGLPADEVLFSCTPRGAVRARDGGGDPR